MRSPAPPRLLASFFAIPLARMVATCVVAASTVRRQEPGADMARADLHRIVIPRLNPQCARSGALARLASSPRKSMAAPKSLVDRVVVGIAVGRKPDVVGKTVDGVDQRQRPYRAIFSGSHDTVSQAPSCRPRPVDVSCLCRLGTAEDRA
jgi:hypothetical protein